MKWFTTRQVPRWDEAEAEVKKYRPDLLSVFQVIRIQVQSRKRREAALKAQAERQTIDTITVKKVETVDEIL